MDTLSSLPDDILCRILSFVTTKEAVATSLLSKRWTHLWLSVPNLHFTNINIDTIESNFRFNESVYSVFVSRDVAHSNFINSFRLEIKYGSRIVYDLAFPHVIKWVNLIVHRGLKYLRLHPYVGEFAANPQPPISILTCKTLVSLDLCRFMFKKGFSFSSNEFGLPSLKTLYLELICFQKVRDFMLLLAKCPILEDLQASCMRFCSWEDSFTIHQEFKSLSLPKLTRANITRCLCFHRQVNQLQHPIDGILLTHKITTLVLINSWNTVVVGVLHHFPKLQNLELYKGLYMAMGNAKGDQEYWVEPKLVPQCLLYLKTCTIRDLLSLQSELMLEKYILKIAKNLETMTIWTEREQSAIERKLSKCPKGSPTCQLLVNTWPY